ncbi:dTDP-4-dehydrorhamnose reductase [methanotrophic endosymbiont of Bathymodiolus puteoserpentis (Logatchev)]|jgi:dTDP-4-dehydrorhamnose reductase|uniref:dTDP-4-dehydrorhamnose reductase n=1 Tax=methanotrophic endosymbiont of Bathymodiolus puteoserpentis (Logatchev) TaxID=343235 RepID=UPI0013C9674B|nr:dTDP-4-dehydrorhamnose reductase [methanotrophic endosymbiont of Bathymodiolus puteoserpentis (Logatchev)]SHE23322.1 dTDP-4-dehydrorhamnose reductase [methanotrophic endosymbiont of Bathymodiolus puteoserpentis (Logatchev)]
MKILLFGKNGQVGWELQRSLAPLGEIIALSSGSQDHCGDLTKLSGLAETVRQVKPDIIVNAAAHTAVDKAESEAKLAHIINADAPGVLAHEAKALDAWLIHYSTDYVFDGSGNTPWLEADVTAPLSVYGATKLAGEQAIQASNCKHLIFRTSWVYGARGNNFAKTMLRLAQERDSLSVINDQIGAPTGADLLADVTAHAIRTAQAQPELSDLYHLVASGETSWYGYASYVIDTAQKMGLQLKVNSESITPVPTSAFPTPAQRPKNSRLNTHKLQTSFNLTLPLWQAGVKRMLTEFIEK